MEPKEEKKLQKAMKKIINEPDKYNFIIGVSPKQYDSLYLELIKGEVRRRNKPDKL